MLRAADITAKTDTGRQRRANEDCALARPPVFVVADGMGGAQAGEVAAGIAVEAFTQGLQGSGSVEERLAGRAREANRQIFKRASAERERAGMGTTLTAAYLDDSELAIAHVGDSRAYLFRDGSLTRLTQDHSLVDELVRRGKLTEEEAAEHPQRSIITRALGPEAEVNVDTWTYPVREGDLLLLCSDGLTSMISEERITAILGSSGDLDASAQALIDEANRAGGRDNITVVLARFEEVETGTDGANDQPTVVGVSPSTRAASQESSGESHEGASGPPSVSARGTVGSARPGDGAATATLISDRRGRGSRSVAQPRERGPGGSVLRPAAATRKRRGRFSKPAAVLLTVVIVLCLIGAGGYLATRQLYFIGTNAQGVVTIYRGLPYNLPAGVPLYETFYVSGVPASLIPPDRRGTLLNNSLRSESNAENLVRALELGRISK